MSFLRDFLRSPVRTVERRDSVTISTRSPIATFVLTLISLPLPILAVLRLTEKHAWGLLLLAPAIGFAIWLAQRWAEVSVRVEADQVIVNAHSALLVKSKRSFPREGLYFELRDDPWGFDGWDAWLFVQRGDISMELDLAFIETGTRFYEELKRALRRKWPTDAQVSKPTSF